MKKLISATDLRKLAPDVVNVDDLNPLLEKISKDLIAAQKENKTTSRIKVTKVPVSLFVLTNALIDEGYTVSESCVGTDKFLVVNW
jgi:hypothetical protein